MLFVQKLSNMKSMNDLNEEPVLFNNDERKERMWKKLNYYWETDRKKMNETSRNERRFDLDDLVMVKKKKNGWNGPWKVTKIWNNGNTYEVKNVGNGSLKQVHISKMKIANGFYKPDVALKIPRKSDEVNENIASKSMNDQDVGKIVRIVENKADGRLKFISDKNERLDQEEALKRWVLKGSGSGSIEEMYLGLFGTRKEAKKQFNKHWNGYF